MNSALHGSWGREVGDEVTALQDCLALGAIFATTDSVAVLQVLEQDRAPLLFNLVFGEGVINDATTVALLRTVQVHFRGHLLSNIVSGERASSGGHYHVFATHNSGTE